MYGNLSLQSNGDGTHDLIIRYGKAADAEFGLDFLTSTQASDRVAVIGAYLNGKSGDTNIRSARIVIGGLVVAVLPVSMALGGFSEA